MVVLIFIVMKEWEMEKESIFFFLQIFYTWHCVFMSPSTMKVNEFNCFPQKIKNLSG